MNILTPTSPSVVTRHPITKKIITQKGNMNILTLTSPRVIPPPPPGMDHPIDDRTVQYY
jgi:hypothetical protein